MSDSTGSVAFDQLAEQFLDAVREGEEPVVEDWAERYPAHEAEIRELFPTILAMEEMKRVDDAKPSRLSLSMGDRLGDFRIVREIGRGGMGVVYEAVQESLGRRVAVKVLPAMGDVRRVKRFEREARTAARLHHTNIVPIFGVGTQGGWHYYVMPVIRGVGLDGVVSWLRSESDGRPSDASAPLELDPATGSGGEESAEAEARDSAARGPGADADSAQPRSADMSVAQLVRALRTGAFRPASTPSTGASGVSSAGDSAVEFEVPEVSIDQLPPDPGPARDIRARYWRSVAWIGRQVASALAYAHAEGVLHRDVKPANLLIDSRGVAWVTDFGLATAVEADGLTRSGDLLGTLQYMAPEQLRGDYDERSDVYALGLTLYELLTLRPAFREADRGQLLEAVARGVSTRPSQLRPGIPRDLETIVLHAVQVEPRHRYRSAAELAEDLQNFLEDRPIRARRATTLEHGWRWCRRNRLVASLGALATAGVVSAAVVGWMGWVSTRDALQRERQQFQLTQEASARAERNLRSATRAFEEIFATLAGPPRLTLVATSSGDTALEALAGAAASTENVANQDAEFAWVSSGTQVDSAQAALLERLLVFYEDFAAEAGNTPKLVAETAAATRRVGDIRLALGRAADAASSYERALRLFAEAEQGGLAANPVVVAAIRNDLARAKLESGDPQQARAGLLVLLEDLGGDQQIAARFERARAHELLGGLEGHSLRARRDRPGFSGMRGAMRPQFEGRPGGRLPGSDGDSPPGVAGGEGRRRPGPQERRGDGPAPGDGRPRRSGPGGPGGGGGPEPVGEGPRRGGRRDGRPPGGGRAPHEASEKAREHFGEALQINLALVEERPDEPEFVLAASRTARAYARVRSFGGGLPRQEVRKQIEAAEQALRHLAIEHPERPAYRAELTELLLEPTGPEVFREPEKWLARLDEGLELAGALHAANPESIDYLRLHRRALFRRGMVEYSMLRRPRSDLSDTERSEAFGRIRARLEAALQLFPAELESGSPDWRERTEMRFKFLEALAGSGETDAARAFYQSVNDEEQIPEHMVERLLRRRREHGPGWQNERPPRRPGRDR